MTHFFNFQAQVQCHYGRVHFNLLSKFTDPYLPAVAVRRGSNGTSNHDSGAQTYPYKMSSAGGHTPPGLMSLVVQSYIAGLIEEYGKYRLFIKKYYSSKVRHKLAIISK